MSQFRSHPEDVSTIRQQFTDREKKLMDLRLHLVAWLNHLKCQVDPSLIPMGSIPTDCIPDLLIDTDESGPPVLVEIPDYFSIVNVDWQMI